MSLTENGGQVMAFKIMKWDTKEQVGISYPKETSGNRIPSAGVSLSCVSGYVFGRPFACQIKEASCFILFSHQREIAGG